MVAAKRPILRARHKDLEALTVDFQLRLTPSAEAATPRSSAAAAAEAGMPLRLRVAATSAERRKLDEANLVWDKTVRPALDKAPPGATAETTALWRNAARDSATIEWARSSAC